MFQLSSLKARVERLTQLEKGPSAELAAWEGAKHPLTLIEREWYVGFLKQAHAALRSARDSLALAVNRLEFDARTKGAGKPTV
jgi:hypothetical protein